MSFAAMLLVAIVLDRLLGWPPALHARIGHPVTWIGAVITVLERRCNDAGRSPSVRRMRGVTTVLIVVGVAGAVAFAAQSALPAEWLGVIAGGVLAWPFLALRSLHEHVAAVASPLECGNTEGARAAVAMIVGRETATLDATEITRAALESLAENTSDGVVAPLFWGLVAGLPGLVAYKAVNTLDSMIGHRNPRYSAFGWAAARLDDVANLVPARLTGALFLLVAGSRWRVLAGARRDAKRHRSPNAGWPEAALARVLDVRLGGPRSYAGRPSDDAWLNGAARDPEAADLQRGLAMYRRSMLGLTALIAVVAAAAGLAEI